MNEKTKTDYVRLKKEWTTNMPMLLKVILNSTGPVCEVGGGPFSTPLLHWLCKIQGRKLTTYENHYDYWYFCHRFTSRDHYVKLIENWDDMDFKTHWGVVFIDHHPEERRGIDVINFKDTADYIIMHDTEAKGLYDWDKINKLFKYKFDWKECLPWTSVVSNFKDLKFLE
jgi:hypothetical protein